MLAHIPRMPEKGIVQVWIKPITPVLFLCNSKHWILHCELISSLKLVSAWWKRAVAIQRFSSAYLWWEYPSQVAFFLRARKFLSLKPLVNLSTGTNWVTSPAHFWSNHWQKRRDYLGQWHQSLELGKIVFLPEAHSLEGAKGYI